MSDRFPRNMPITPTIPSATSQVNLPGAWPSEPAAPTATASVPPLAAHSARGAVPSHRRRRSARALENPMITHGRSMPHPSDSTIPVLAPSSYGTQQSNVGPVEANTVCSITSRELTTSRHPYLQLNPHKTDTNVVKVEEVLQDTKSYVPQPLSESHAPRGVSKNGSWTKKEEDHFRKRLEAVYERQVELEKQAAFPTAVRDLTTAPITAATMAATMAAPQLHRKHYPSVNSSKMWSSRANLSIASHSAPVSVKTPEPATTNPKLSDQLLAGTRNVVICHTEAAPPSPSSIPSGSSTNDIARNSTSTPGLMADAACSKREAYAERQRPEPRRATQFTPYARNVDQQAEDLRARHKRNEEKRRLASRLHAEAQSSRANSKATAELQQITKGMQNMRITHLAAGVSMPSIRSESRPPAYLNAVAQHQRVYPTVTAPSLTDINILLANKYGLFAASPETNDGKRPRGSTSHKSYEKTNPGQPSPDTSTEKGDKDIMEQSYWAYVTKRSTTAEEVQMQELRKQILVGRLPTPEIPTPSDSNPKDEKMNVQKAGVSTDARAKVCRETSREDHMISRRPNDNAVPVGVSSQPSPESATGNENPSDAGDNMDLSESPSPSPCSTSPSNGTFTDIPLSSSPQPSPESDFVEVDVGDVDDLEWVIIRGSMVGDLGEISKTGSWWRGKGRR